MECCQACEGAQNVEDERERAYDAGAMESEAVMSFATMAA